MKLRSEFLVFGRPTIEQDEIDEVVDSLQCGWLGTGPKVRRFEQDFASYKGVASATAVNSCTAALHLSLLAADIGPGDEVITSALTFCATVNAIIHAGATPILADVDPVTFNIDPREVEKKITRKTRALLPVHFAGNPCDLGALSALATRHGLILIEDCAHAIEAEYQTRKVGTVGDFGCFSFYATKNVCTGEGGMVLARKESHLDRIKSLALHGLSRDAWHRYSDAGFRHYEVHECGFKYNMMDLQAALGLHQLAKVERRWTRRRDIALRYAEAFSDLPITLPPEALPGNRHAHHLYPLRIARGSAGFTRDEFIEAMTGLRVGVGVHYRSIPTHRYYQTAFQWRPEDYPHAFQIGEETVSLPLSATLAEEDVEYVIEAVHQVLGSRTTAAQSR